MSEKTYQAKLIKNIKKWLVRIEINKTNKNGIPIYWL